MVGLVAFSVFARSGLGAVNAGSPAARRAAVVAALSAIVLLLPARERSA